MLLSYAFRQHKYIKTQLKILDDTRLTFYIFSCLIKYILMQFLSNKTSMCMHFNALHENPTAAVSM